MLQTTDGSLNMRIRTLALPVGEDEQTAESQQRASLVRHRCYIGGTKFCSERNAVFALSYLVSAQLQFFTDLCQRLFGASNCSRAALALASLELSLEDADIKLIHPPPPCFSSSSEVSGRWSLSNQRQL